MGGAPGREGERVHRREAEVGAGAEGEPAGLPVALTEREREPRHMNERDAVMGSEATSLQVLEADAQADGRRHATRP